MPIPALCQYVPSNLPFKGITIFLFIFIISIWVFFDLYFLFEKLKEVDKKAIIEPPQLKSYSSKNRLLAGILQLVVPGFGRIYLGHWIHGFLQTFLIIIVVTGNNFILSYLSYDALHLRCECILSFLYIIVVFYAYFDGHRILFSSNIKDRKGKILDDKTFV